MNARFAEHGGARTSSSTVTFGHPFQLGSDPRELPPGTYLLHTEEHRFSSGDHNWSARADVVVEVRHGGATAYRHVAPADLDRAVAIDVAKSVALSDPSENPDRGQSR